MTSGISVGSGSAAGTAPTAGAGGPVLPFGIGGGNGSPGGWAHIVYVLDVSPSMESRIDRARAELKRSMHDLHSGDSFTIIAFGGSSITMSVQLVDASPTNLAAADAFLDHLQLMPGTNLEESLTRALGVDGSNQIVLITDGWPTVGQTDFGKLEELFRGRNTRHKPISTIGLVGLKVDGKEDTFEATELLLQIAKDSGGRTAIVEVGVATPD